jgi:outer membrane protein assembly factor BamA
MANIWTVKNKYNILLDYRFLKYPSTTYGLGPATTDDNAYTLNFNYIKFHQTILKKLYKQLYAGVGFYYDHFWNISEVDPPVGIKTSFQRYGANETETAAGFVARILNDKRDNQINPATGSYSSIVYRPNYRFLGSDNNWQSLQTDYRKYIRFPGRSKNVLALWEFNWFTLGNTKPPYLLLPSTGWDDQYNTGRGFIQSRFKAKEMMYAEAEYRFGITGNGLLGAVVFVNAQSFSKRITDELNVIAPGAGAGLRIKLNKHTNTNLCIDYGFGMIGSRGLFLNLGEVF